MPIEWIKFPAARGENGQKPVAAENEIRIDIDINNEGCCTSIDWAQVHFKAMAPLLLIHGIGADPQAAWEVEPGVTQHLIKLGIPFEHRIQIGRSDRILPERDLIGNIIEQERVMNF
ncbi:hypothetical protein IQ230_25930 [Gloeocapsopsis crepidinum LEGE 06123]|uniref:Alpha/beta hydrolase n=1 Tax=Gloeocapsopsis crepidinum LEGE 06123 TaxID=588587 RepID=A0ABR9UZF1_9CHRO|nr:hypothetical protein [Gloeocapsopsis crepidinum LEGE 06123]